VRDSEQAAEYFHSLYAAIGKTRPVLCMPARVIPSQEFLLG
jgi:hypothetical protein